MRYYSTQRPVSPGTYPNEGVTNVYNFDARIYCKEIKREAWGFIDYKRELSESELGMYELIPEGTPWYAVTIASRKKGGGLRAVVDTKTQRSICQPPDEQWETKKRTFKRHWYEDYNLAEMAVEALNNMEVSIERVRSSVTQGEVKTYVNGQYILNWADTIEIIKDGEEYYGSIIGDWASKKPDSTFVLGLIWHPLDNIYHYSDKIKKALGL